MGVIDSARTVSIINRWPIMTHPRQPKRRWHRAESFQLISAGHDGRFGPGGQWSASESGPPLPGDGREEEQDNLSNFKRGTLGE